MRCLDRVGWSSVGVILCGVFLSTRRVDVDTKWLNRFGVTAAKDVLTVQQYHKLRNHLEDKYKGVRIPSAKFAEEILR